MSHLKVLRSDSKIPIHEYRDYLRKLPVRFNRPGIYFDGVVCWKEGILCAHKWKDPDNTDEGKLVAVEYPADVFKYQLESFDIPLFSKEHLEVLSRANQLVPNKTISKIIAHNKREKYNREQRLRAKLRMKVFKRNLCDH